VKELAQRVKELASRVKELAQRVKELAQRVKELAQREQHQVRVQVCEQQWELDLDLETGPLHHLHHLQRICLQKCSISSS